MSVGIQSTRPPSAMPWPLSAVNSGPRRLSQAHGITETCRNSQPTCSAASCSSPADRLDVQSQAYPSPGQLFDFIHHQPFEQSPRTILRNIGISYWSAVAAALGSLGCFGSGVFFTAQAFSVLGVQ